MSSVLFNYLRRRFRSGTKLTALGPNEARVLFDLGAGSGAVVLSGLFRIVFIPHPPKGVLLWPFLALAFLAFNALFGIYSRLRQSSARIKCLALALAVCASCGLALAAGFDTAVIVVWGALTLQTVLLARLLLGLPHSRHKTLASLAVNRNGPVLVIGGAGYIGSHTVDLLLQQGFKVRVLDKLMYGRDSLAEWLDNRNFELIEGDVTDITKLTLAVRGASAVIHLSGLVGDPACAVDPEFTRHTNIVATRMAKDVAQSLGVHRFIFASSCSVYGTSEKEVSETDDLNPVSLYAQTKIDSEKELLFSARDDFFVTILRFATVFGHSRRPRFDLVGNLFTAQAMNDGLITVTGPNQWRPFVHVRDLARAIVAVLRADPSLVQGQTYNVGDERLNLTILQLAEAVKAVASEHRPVEIEVREDAGDRRNYAVSFKKIHSDLNFEAATLLDDGIREMVDNFLADRYQNYRAPVYSNVAITRLAIHEFYDPSELNKLYGPLKVG